ncbi:sigma-54 dependent transcriptional regulator [Barnesiella viscericola]|uniref:sigma-54 interaction domain-containing protein n=1 Tax=Barnesiella viscericola TaxID=397865 RepID=UPI0025A4150C|nr:sigma-54 dependent transcriptional regulator [Barnesiella viscericola]MDM8267955.1 sigma-54 dependent transcriptional regulator [Barnesiella viscericola]
MIPADVQQTKQRFGIIGNAPGLIRAITRALQIAPIDLAVLITGESGAGKEFFPQIIHANSSRKHGKYIAVNCGAIPEGTIDSELFGHEKGAFTGALSARKGYFEEADGGTIFLDEVGELPLTTQARLLRVLESGEFLKVGSSTVLKTNVRIVAATNLDMVKAVSEGKFREDLYYRLSTIHIEIPPLRERADDILLLFRKFSTDFAERYRMPVIQLTDDARNVLLNYRWPGNVRQLKNITEQISIFETNREVDGATLQGYLPQYNIEKLPARQAATPGEQDHTFFEKERKMLYKTLFEMQKELADLHAKVEELTKAAQGQPHFTPPTQSVTVARSMALAPITTAVPVHVPASKGKTIDETEGEVIPNEAEYVEEQPTTLEDTERETIRKALMRNHGKRKKTAEELKISERTLYRKIKEYNLE